MWRLLIRIFPVVFISMLSAIVVVICILYYSFDNWLVRESLDYNKSHVFLLKEYLSKSQSQQELQQRFKNYQQQHFGTTYIIPIDGLTMLSPEMKQRLLDGETVSQLRTNYLSWIYPVLYFRLGDSDKAIFIDSVKSLENPDDVNVIIYGSILLVFLFFLSLWSSFHWAELKKLIRATEQITQGDFSARAKVNKYASTYLVAYKVNQMAAYIERLINGQRDLIHSVSHELRSPIARLSFGMELLQKISQKIDQNDQLRPRISELDRDVTELNDLVNELLQLATVGQQYLTNFQRFDLGAMLHDSLKILKNSRHAGYITTSWPAELGDYNGDEHLLERVVTNVLHNADKYAVQRISLSAKKLPNGDYEIVIEDDGPGIAVEERERIFEPFYRLENIWDKKISGYGLGLSIVHKIVLVHHGSVDIETSTLGGAKFIIRLPTL
ncbi:ATP-binding protein [Serratia aquatilis]|uniref:histidine kinase n=1 Tax=Serratia aquatilis TaxID=1737515 RepID=A0ABV6EEG3_9GAMM